MAIVTDPTCKLHAHNYIPNILGGGGPQTLLVSLFMDILHLKYLVDAKVSSTNAVWVLI